MSDLRRQEALILLISPEQLEDISEKLKVKLTDGAFLINAKVIVVTEHPSGEEVKDITEAWAHHESN